MPFLFRALALAAATFSLVALAGCDAQRISELQPGISTEADVRDRFGVPETIWDEADGARTLEYNRQPAGQINYMITVGADGRLVAVRQVLTPENFARITPGTDAAFLESISRLKAPRRRDGATFWRVYKDLGQPSRYVERFIVESWADYLHQRARATMADQALETEVRAYLAPGETAKMSHYIAER